MPGFARARQVVDRFIEDRVAPCAVVEVGTAEDVACVIARGRLTFEPGSSAATDATVFDLASLTKVLSTGTVAMRLVGAGRLDLRTRLADLLPTWLGADRAAATVTDLLAHSSGLPSHRPYHERLSGRAAFEAAIGAEPLEFAPGGGSLYSDLGYILLGFALEDAGGAPLDVQTRQAFEAIEGEVDVRFGLPAEWRPRTAPTSNDPTRSGLVDDRNAEALGGVAGHAGLFGTAAGVGAIARAVLGCRSSSGRSSRLAPPDLVRRFTSQLSASSSRALGWDTMLPTSSCGVRMSAQAFGHTGFTGTSLWIDPGPGLYVVLLTNRVYPSPGTAEGITAFRRALHDAVMLDWAGR
jgi:serine-type D-Ala-D-Ala carboxypeptidase